MVITSGNKVKKFYSLRQLYYALAYILITSLVLVFLNVSSSHLSQSIFSENKESEMLKTANLAAAQLAKEDPAEPSTLFSDIYGVAATVTDASGHIIYSPEGVDALPEQILPALQGQTVFFWEYSAGIIHAQAAVPVSRDDQILGCVYMEEYDHAQGRLIQAMQINIFTITALLELGVLIFSIWSAVRYSRRMRQILESMRVIQRGDFSHKVSMKGHDELSFLAKEFNRMTERLQISENKRRQFVSDASHELKTPLASIKLLSDSILQNDMDMETVREFVSDIGQEADRLNRMTLKLLELTRGENKAEDVESEIIYLAPTVQRVVKMLSSIAESNQISVSVDLSQDAPILIHEGDLYQIAFNLAENGIKYNTPGGQLKISLLRHGDNVVLRVSDTGMGIPPDAISHIFERFYRVDKARSRSSGGSGLGLAIVRSMVERNNGEISLQSTLGKGTTFTVEFPIFETEVDA